MTVTNILIAQIDPPNPILRRFSESSVDFLELVDQIKSHGGSLQVPPGRLLTDGRVQIIDGYRRYRAHVHAGLAEMQFNLVQLDDVQYLAAQMQCNSGHEDTDWIDFARHLDRLRYLTDDEMTLAELAAACGKSKTWVGKILNLNKLPERFKVMVQRNEIPIGNALWLARLPIAEQGQYVDDAKTMKTGQFERLAQQGVNNYREGIKQGKLKKLGTDALRPNMRDLRIIEAEIITPVHLPVMIASAGLTNPIEIAVLALKWAFRIDPGTIQERKEKMLSLEHQRINDARRRSNSRESLRFQEQSKTAT